MSYLRLLGRHRISNEKSEDWAAVVRKRKWFLSVVRNHSILPSQVLLLASTMNACYDHKKRILPQMSDMCWIKFLHVIYIVSVGVGGMFMST